MEQLVNLRYLTIGGDGEILERLDFTPLASLSELKNVTLQSGVLREYRFKELEQLINLEFLSIEDEGEVLATADFTPLALLNKLESISFGGNIIRLPDLTRLTNLRTIHIVDPPHVYATLESLEGIGAPNVKKIHIRSNKEIDSFAPLNNLMCLEELEIWGTGEKVYKIADMANLPRLKRLRIDMDYAKIDLRGIEHMSALEDIHLRFCEPFNIEGIGKLANLETISINLISPKPSLEFLRGMQNISYLYLYADNNRLGFPNTEAYQILDVGPLSSVKSLQKLYCTNFIIKNISALDVLDELSYSIDLFESRLYDETEKSTHSLFFVNGE
jgi:Leucine-rich repeat (LRR) protein